MNAEDAIINDSCQWQEIEHLHELLPHYKASILALALNLKAIDLSDLAGLMVAPQHVEAERVP